MQVNLLNEGSMKTLILLAKEGAHPNSLKISLSWLAGHLGTSRQTAARRLADLESNGLIARRQSPRGQEVRLTRKGVAVLRSIHRELEMIFATHPRALELRGKVVPGPGEGKYYMGQEGYKRQFKRRLGFIPYPGTLDVELDDVSRVVKEELQILPGIKVNGFKTSERTFGSAKCFEAKLRGKRVVVVLPSRTHRPDVVELVAPINLREKLKLSNDSAVKIEVVA